ncbi:MAG: hypothetical protein KC442_15975 [Thermomicrobiales bacterium]|nr:hypothetical protein [Thermomicrobiales bacterium]
MSRHELVEAYIANTINRRAFIQGMTALGVSAGVAAAYAVALRPAAAGDGPPAGSCDPRLPPELYELYCGDPDPGSPDTGDGGGGTDTGGKKKRRKRRKRRKKGKKKRG